MAWGYDTFDGGQLMNSDEVERWLCLNGSILGMHHEILTEFALFQYPEVLIVTCLGLELMYRPKFVW